MIDLKDINPKMIANNLTPSQPIHPGEILKDEIEYRGISQRLLAKEMDMSYTVLNEILNAKRPVTTEFALLIEASLGIDAAPLLKMQMDYNMQTVRNNNKFVERLDKMRRITAVF